MANEHIKTAASNLQRAAQDERERQSELRREIDNAKRTCDTRMADIKAQMTANARNALMPNTNDVAKRANAVHVQSLKAEMAKIKKDTDLYISHISDQAKGLDGHIGEFENLASHLNNIA
ncbi:hypothetical protein BH10PAT3_BH10PAT3_8480 [soil metagenome]